eukprot:500207-Rhodomonas_salina.1
MALRCWREAARLGHPDAQFRSTREPRHPRRHTSDLERFLQFAMCCVFLPESAVLWLVMSYAVHGTGLCGVRFLTIASGTTEPCRCAVLSHRAVLDHAMRGTEAAWGGTGQGRRHVPEG